MLLCMHVNSHDYYTCIGIIILTSISPSSTDEYSSSSAPVLHNLSRLSLNSWPSRVWKSGILYKLLSHGSVHVGIIRTTRHLVTNVGTNNRICWCIFWWTCMVSRTGIYGRLRCGMLTVTLISLHCCTDSSRCTIAGCIMWRFVGRTDGTGVFRWC